VRPAALAVLVAAALAALPAEAHARSAAERSLTVMTRNVFLGADLSPLVGTRTPDELSLAAGAIWSRIQASDFPRRARALAAEIAAAKPDVVGLQEVSLYRSDRPSDGPITPAETVEQDYLRILLAALKARGQHYRAAATFESGELEVPVGLPPTMDISAMDRDSMLVREGAARRGIRVRGVIAGEYVAATDLPLAGTTLRAPRDWIATTLSVRGRKVVVFDTHLDSVSAQVRAAQGQELLRRVRAIRGPVVVLGDLNSGPGSDTTVYDTLRAGGLHDAWTQVHGAAPGLTCCFSPDLRSTARAFSSRIDLVLSRNGVRATRAEVVGEAPSDRVHGLWPSDHAGVVAKLRLP
jgi:endonuclease/exonuclease/phosphatase family metal-dependent hydrolase